MTAAVSAAGLSKHYGTGGQVVKALDDVSFEIPSGSFAAVVGPSGSGKSTLLHIVGALDTPSSGTIAVQGEDLSAMSDDRLTSFRRRKLGFVFQFFNLMPTMTAWENVALPLLLDGMRLEATRARAEQLLGMVGLVSRSGHKPAEMSGGEIQRVAVARALAADPPLLLADEPTGNLDSASGQAVLDLLRNAVDEHGKTVVLVTHDGKAASIADTTIRLADGRVVTS
ncbi:MAG: ABC transporter ATP-binding protein [Actinomycetota bacterium]